jgi:hypothetical protein
MKSVLGRFLGSVIACLLVVSLVACGTILYPERRGQDGGKLDTDVVILDAVGLFFFLVPGVIAFAVDFVTGAIYLPAGDRSKTSEVLGQAEIQRHDLPASEPDAIAAVIEEQTGMSVDLRSGTVVVVEAYSVEDVWARLLDMDARARGDSRPRFSSIGPPQALGPPPGARAETSLQTCSLPVTP